MDGLIVCTSAYHKHHYTGSVRRTLVEHEKSSKTNTMMWKMSKSVVFAIDVCRTLLTMQSIADKLASHFCGDTAKTLATWLRKHQRESTWRLNSMGMSLESVHDKLH